MKRNRWCKQGIGVAACVLAVGLVACEKHKEDAVAELGKIEAACAKQDQEGARQFMRDAATNNPVFKEAYEKSKTNWSVKDDAKVNPCGIFLADLKKRLGN